MEKQRTKIKQKQNSIDLLKPLKKISKRFNLILFFIFVIGCLAGAILLINNTLQETSTDPYTSTIDAGNIDQVTLNRLNALHSSSQSTPAPTLPTGRTNPVNE